MHKAKTPSQQTFFTFYKIILNFYAFFCKKVLTNQKKGAIIASVRWMTDIKNMNIGLNACIIMHKITQNA